MNGEKLRRLAGTEYPRIALIVVGVVALLAVVIWVPKLSFIQPGGLTKATDRAKAESDLRGHLLQALAGVVLAAGAYFTGRTFAQNRKEQDRTYALAREGQITERFTRAVEQLGDKKLDIRLGGIYALERIAQDSKTHYEPVMEVLTAFLRENTRWRREKAAEKAEETPQEPEQPREPPRPTADFQAVATVLGRRNRSQERASYRLNLRDVDLRGGDLQEAHLASANLREDDLSAAHLSRATLFEANLSDADLSEADLREANVREANLSGAVLREANVREADLSGADLSSVEGLTQEQLDSAVMDENTKLPEYLQDAGQRPGGEPNA
jgi:hypothetical protein